MEKPELLLELLRQMAEDVGGRTYVIHAPNDPEEMSKYHHCELLEDAGHAVFVNKAAVRITRQGRDFLNAVQSEPKAKAVFFQSMKDGLSFAKAVSKAIELFNDLFGP